MQEPKRRLGQVLVAELGLRYNRVRSVLKDVYGLLPIVTHLFYCNEMRSLRLSETHMPSAAQNLRVPDQTQKQDQDQKMFQPLSVLSFILGQDQCAELYVSLWDMESWEQSLAIRA